MKHLILFSLLTLSLTATAQKNKDAAEIMKEKPLNQVSLKHDRSTSFLAPTDSDAAYRLRFNKKTGIYTGDGGPKCGFIMVDSNGNPVKSSVNMTMILGDEVEFEVNGYRLRFNKKTGIYSGTGDVGCKIVQTGDNGENVNGQAKLVKHHKNDSQLEFN